MKKKLWILSLALASLMIPSGEATAQIPVVSLVSTVVKKVIMALDLKVQQLQNQTIALQNAEKQAENSLHLNSLNDISGWLGKERTLYQDYYTELSKVKTVIADYQEVKTIISQQAQLLTEYHQASTLFHQDPHFSAAELQAMENIYAGMLEESARNLDELLLTVGSFSTQMDDAERMAVVHHACTGMQTNLNHLRQYNQQNVAISYERAKDETDRQNLKQLYGIR